MSRVLYQFGRHYDRNVVAMQGNVVLGVPVAASLIVQDITYTAATTGDEGNDITIAYTGGATAGAEVVSVVGTAISIQIETGVSTATQVKAAFDAEPLAVALAAAAITGTAGTAQVVAAATNLASGSDGITSTNMTGITAVNKIGAGEYEFTYDTDETYNTLLATHASLFAATPVDLVPQFETFNLTTNKFKINLMTGATPTDPGAAATLYVSVFFKFV